MAALAAAAAAVGVVVVVVAAVVAVVNFGPYLLRPRPKTERLFLKIEQTRVINYHRGT